MPRNRLLSPKSIANIHTMIQNGSLTLETAHAYGKVWSFGRAPDLNMFINNFIITHH